jgi:UDP-glucose 4-epimerase
MSRRRILITGGGGFVGSHLAESYARMGCAVTAIDTAFDPQTLRRLAGVTCAGAPLAAEGLGHLGREWDLVIHGAALTSSPAELGLTDAAHAATNVDLLLAALNFAERASVGAFVFLSSSGVFAARDGTDRLVETTAPSGASAYALAKRAGEVLMAGQAGSMRRLSARLGYLYGPDERPRRSRTGVSLVRSWLDAAESRSPLRVTTPDVRRDWTFAPDLAGAIDAALATDAAPSLVHLGSGEAVTDLALAETIAAVTGARIEVVPEAVSATKAPMSSLFALPVRWTPLADGIAACARQAVAA